MPKVQKTTDGLHGHLRDACRQSIECLILYPLCYSTVMPVISMFYGVIVSMYFLDTKQHKEPHIHVRYGSDEAVIRIPDGSILAGGIDPRKMKLVAAWIELHQDELMADWSLAVAGQQIFKIEPLR